MPEYLSPGVYVEEVPSTIKPIAGVSTSTAAFVGVFDGTKIEIPYMNPKFDPSTPTKPVVDPKNPPDPNDPATNSPYRTWHFPATDDEVKAAKDRFDGLALPDVKPARPKGDVKLSQTWEDFRTAQEEYARALAHRNASDMVPEGVPTLCTTFADFKRYFGDFSTEPGQNRLAQGVYGFFNNEGTR